MILFNDGKSIELPIVDRAKEKTINFLKEACQKSPKKIKTNKLAKKLLVV